MKKLPFNFPQAKDGEVHSLTAVDCLTPKWNALMKYSDRDVDTPIWVIGSGKTAMDAIIAIAGLGPSVRRRLHCVTGHGVFFMNRDMMQSLGDSASSFGKAMMDGLKMYNGENAKEVYRFLASQGAMISAFPDAETHMNAIASPAEMAIVKEVLSPARERIVKAHLLDIVREPGGGLALELRACGDGPDAVRGSSAAPCPAGVSS